METHFIRVQYTEMIAKGNEAILLNCLNLETFLPNIHT